MNVLLKKLLEKEHSKRQKDIIVKEILAGKVPLKDLIKVMMEFMRNVVHT